MVVSAAMMMGNAEQLFLPEHADKRFTIYE